MAKKMISIDLSNRIWPSRAEGFIKFFQEEFDKLSTECKENAVFELEARKDEYDHEYISVTLEYFRDETNDEAIARSQLESNKAKIAANRELATYHRLKLRFEGI
tara:strand:- start:1546 stop:1860 length:315 start_codon:yes stop_codon:yes gene_type:complete